MESIDIPQGEEHLGIGLPNAIGVKFQWVPWSASGDHVPSCGISTFSIEVVPRVDNVAT